MNQSNPIIVALDYKTATEAFQTVELLGNTADYYKVGLQLLTAEGPDVVRRLRALEKRVFLDLKVLEIPNSVAGAVDSAGRLGASMITIHASGGKKVLAAAVEAAKPYPDLNVLGLTVISSMTQVDLEQVGVNSTVDEQVIRLANLSAECGCQGIVASALETKLLRKEIPDEMLIVTPGIKLADTGVNDQQRTSSPSASINAGASFLVIGRAITRAKDPVAAFAEAHAQAMFA
jgi:orotidine-5'-phosphate decarboxylase